MKWDYDLETRRELGVKDGALTGDVIEALRAIAEQLERCAIAFEDSARPRAPIGELTRKRRASWAARK